MKREEVIALARKSGFLIDGVQEFVFARTTLHFTEEMVRFANEVERRTIEKCAQVQGPLTIDQLNQLPEIGAVSWPHSVKASVIRAIRAVERRHGICGGDT